MIDVLNVMLLFQDFFHFITFYFCGGISVHLLAYVLFVIRLTYCAYSTFIFRRHRLIHFSFSFYFYLFFFFIQTIFNKTCIIFWKFNKNSFDYGLNLKMNELFSIISTKCEQKGERKNSTENETHTEEMK